MRQEQMVETNLCFNQARTLSIVVIGYNDKKMEHKKCKKKIRPPIAPEIDKYNGNYNGEKLNKK